MTRKEKELLLKDLCARLPYGVKYDCMYTHQVGIVAKELTPIDLFDITDNDWLDGVILYLRPMSSMTEEEKEDFYWNVLDMDAEDVRYENDGKLPMPYSQGDKLLWFENIYIDNVYRMMDWLNARHFDYRNLIGLGLALEAPADMYNLDK